MDRIDCHVEYMAQKLTFVMYDANDKWIGEVDTFEEISGECWRWVPCLTSYPTYQDTVLTFKISQ